MPLVDLSYLTTFCKGDTARMQRYIRAYLDAQPGGLAQLKEKLTAGDADGLAVVAHSLRPQATFMGAHGVLDALHTIEQCARSQGAAACADAIAALEPLHAEVNAELRTHLNP